MKAKNNNTAKVIASMQPEAKKIVKQTAELFHISIGDVLNMYALEMYKSMPSVVYADSKQYQTVRRAHHYLESKLNDIDSTVNQLALLFSFGDYLLGVAIKNSDDKAERQALAKFRLGIKMIAKDKALEELAKNSKDCNEKFQLYERVCRHTILTDRKRRRNELKKRKEVLE